MKKKVLSFILMFLFTGVSFTAPIPQQQEQWSNLVSGIRGRLVFKKGEIVNGTQLIKVFMELQNDSDVLNPVEMLFDPTKTIQAELFNSAGKPVSKASSSMDIMTPPPFYLLLPHDSMLRFDITVSGYGITKDQSAFIPLYSGAWSIENDDISNYYLSVTYTVPMDFRTTRRLWTGMLEIPKTRITLTNE